MGKSDLDDRPPDGFCTVMIELMILPPELWPAVQRLAGGSTWPPQDGPEGDRFVERCAGEGLLPLLFEETSLPDAVRSSLTSHRALQRSFAARAEIWSRAFDRFRVAMGDEPYVVLKGADYATRLYPDPTLRPMNDVDVFVPTARLPEVFHRLTRGGLNPTFPAGPASRVPQHHEFVFASGSIAVEVHHRFLPPMRCAVSYDRLWSARIPTGSHANEYRLADGHAFLYHALSMAIKEFAFPWIRYVDMWLMLKGSELDLPQIAVVAREWRCETALYAALLQFTRILPSATTPAVRDVMASLLRPRRRAFLFRWVLPDPLATSGQGGKRRVHLWRKLWLIDRMRHRAGYPLYLLYAHAYGRLLARRDRRSQPAEENSRTAAITKS
jgi:hypothetical protein